MILVVLVLPLIFAPFLQHISHSARMPQRPRGKPECVTARPESSWDICEAGSLQGSSSDPLAGYLRGYMSIGPSKLTHILDKRLAIQTWSDIA